MKKERWYRLDNAAKVFPCISNEKRTTLFRLSMTLTEDVNPFLLKEAIELVLPRFSGLNTHLHPGLFWYYLDKNENKIEVYEETGRICKLFKPKDNNGYLFRFFYYQKRVAIEVLHALTDGTGALELLKSVIYTYLHLNGKNVSSDGMILTDDVEERLEEVQDSFIKNYDKSLIVNRKEQKALQMDGTYYDDNYLSLITGTCNSDDLKALAKSHNATVTEFICACIILSARRSLDLFENKKKPFKVFLPINLRRFFPSKTMRNFSLYARTTHDIFDDKSFLETLEIVKNDMKSELVKEKLQARIVGNVKLEKNIFMRIAPLCIKEIAMKIGYTAWGDSANSFAISNLGVVNLPESMKEYVKDIVFTNGCSHYDPVNLGVVTYNGKVKMSFLSSIVERNIQKEFFRILTGFGLEIEIDSNEVEV